MHLRVKYHILEATMLFPPKPSAFSLMQDQTKFTLTPAHAITTDASLFSVRLPNPADNAEWKVLGDYSGNHPKWKKIAIY